MDWIKLANAEKATLIDLTAQLIQHKSIYDESTVTVTTPFGKDISNALEFILDVASKMGFTVKNCDNMVGFIELGEGEEMVGAIGHLDTVPVGSGWNYDPFGGTIDQEQIFGRGASDNKGPTIATLVALKILKSIGAPLRRRCRLILSLDEETHFRCMLHYAKYEEPPKYGFVPDGKFPLTYAEKGLYDFGFNGTLPTGMIHSFKCGSAPNVVPDSATMSVDYDEAIQTAYNAYLDANHLIGKAYQEDNQLILEAKGESVHGSQPQNGVHAGFILLNFIKNYTDEPFVDLLTTYFVDKYYGEGFDFQCSDDICGPLTLNVGVLNYERGGIFDLHTTTRYPLPFDQAAAELKLQTIARSYGLTYIKDDHFPPIYNDPNADWIQTLYSIYQEQTGDTESPMETAGGITLARTLPNFTTFGLTFPGTPPQGVHGIDEWVGVDELVKGCAIYAQAFYELANMDE